MMTVGKLGNRVVELYGTAFSYLEQLFAETSGATAIEYGLIAALIAVAAVGVMGTVGTNLSSTFSTVASALQTPALSAARRQGRAHRRNPAKMPRHSGRERR
jgi:pilus assembly protein Flp/PilA